MYHLVFSKLLQVTAYLLALKSHISFDRSNMLKCSWLLEPWWDKGVRQHYNRISICKILMEKIPQIYCYYVYSNWLVHRMNKWSLFFKRCLCSVSFSHSIHHHQSSSSPFPPVPSGTRQETANNVTNGKLCCAASFAADKFCPFTVKAISWVSLH